MCCRLVAGHIIKQRNPLDVVLKSIGSAASPAEPFSSSYTDAPATSVIAFVGAEQTSVEPNLPVSGVLSIPPNTSEAPVHVLIGAAPASGATSMLGPRH